MLEARDGRGLRAVALVGACAFFGCQSGDSGTPKGVVGGGAVTGEGGSAGGASGALGTGGGGVAAGGGAGSALGGASTGGSALAGRGGGPPGGAPGSGGAGGAGGAIGSSSCDGFVMPNPVASGLPNPAAYDTSVADVVTD